MATVATRYLSMPVGFEISIHNVDKGPLTNAEIDNRLAQFDEHQVVWLTCTDTFVKKTRIFHQPTFVVGVDTIQRVADVSYYGGRRAIRATAINQLRDRGCRFLVFGRQIDGLFQQLVDCELPSQLLEICKAVPETDFRRDVSSRQMRESQTLDQ